MSSFYIGLGEAEFIIRARNVKRWHIVPMTQEQTIAEHQFNVASLCMHVMKGRHFAPAVIEWALVHDLPEVITGDFPTHIKHYKPEIKASIDRMEMEIMPAWWRDAHDRFKALPEPARLMFKACDIADTLMMAKYINHGLTKGWVQKGMGGRFESIWMALNACEDRPYIEDAEEYLREYVLYG